MMAEAKASIKPRYQRLLHAKSGNHCAMCKRRLVDGSSNDTACVGENAHIYGEKPGSARYEVEKSSDFVNSYENLIFLCTSCHKIVDTEVDSFPVHKLLEIKKQHEKWVIEKLEEESNKFTFSELEILSKYLMGISVDVEKTPDYQVTKIKEKIKKNSLEPVNGEINIGLIRILTVEDYLNRNPDPYFSERLTDIMSKQYNDLKAICADTVEIFQKLWDTTSGNKTEFQFRAAGLAILVYFFEKCEVFEK